METVDEISTIQQSSYLARDEEPTVDDSTSTAARRRVRGKTKTTNNTLNLMNFKRSRQQLMMESMDNFG